MSATVICLDHDFTQFEETYYGWQCPKCKLLIPFGCGPWEDEAEPSEHDEEEYRD